MNYTVVVVGAVVIIAGAFWLLSGHRTFKGPKRVDGADEADQSTASGIQASGVSANAIQLEQRVLDQNPPKQEI